MVSHKDPILKDLKQNEKFCKIAKYGRVDYI
jgi:hypothetical protein